MRENNFDLLRFVFAFVVFLAHAHALTRNAVFELFYRLLSSDLAVKGFFIISGHLVYMSYCHAKSTGDYFSKRVRRIYPAYLAVILACAIGGAFLTRYELQDYISKDLFRYLAANVVFLNFLAPTLPGVFESNVLQAVNGALWTLKIEVMFYVALPLIAVAARRWGHEGTFVLLYIASVAYSTVLLRLFSTTGEPLLEMLARQMPGQLTYFVVGMASYHYRDRFRPNLLMLIAAVFTLILTPSGVISTVLDPVALAIVVIYIAIVMRYLGNFGKYGDLSYGVYIVHFPILQTMISAGLFLSYPYAALAMAILLVLVSAFFSWHLVEKSWLSRSSHYLTISQQR